MLLESDDTFLMSRFYFFDYLSFLNFLNGGFAILIKMVTYNHNARMVFELGNNRLYISCLRWRSMEKIFINCKILYNTDKNLIECFS